MQPRERVYGMVLVDEMGVPDFGAWQILKSYGNPYRNECRKDKGHKVTCYIGEHQDQSRIRTPTSCIDHQISSIPQRSMSNGHQILNNYSLEFLITERNALGG